jgi:DNA recombination protein RmuC
MPDMTNLIIFAAGILLGFGLCALIGRSRKGDAETVAKQMEEQMKNAFSTLSMEALKSNTSHFLQVAKSQLQNETKMGAKELDGKKQLIDQTLTVMKGDLEKVEVLMKTLEKDRANKFGELTEQLKNTNQETAKLRETTDSLKSALASTKTRGQWGQRMAEDVLRFAGFVEGVNYLKEKTLSTVSTRPDFTFLLPQNLKLNMDVKFPLSAYTQYMEAKSDMEREKHKKQFLSDVRLRIKEVQSRDYINPAENTLDYAIAFIPNEQIYAFIQEHDGEILKDSLESKIILCSPLTLYAVLAVIRQAVDNFKLEKAAAEMQQLFGSFTQQWAKFQESMQKMGKKIGEAQDEFDTLVTTRKNMLERPLKKIEEIRVSKGLPVTTMLETADIIDDVTATAELVKDKNVRKVTKTEQVTMAME